MRFSEEGIAVVDERETRKQGHRDVVVKPDAYEADPSPDRANPDQAVDERDADHFRPAMRRLGGPARGANDPPSGAFPHVVAAYVGGGAPTEE
jgi:hypothetical protein